MYSCGAKNNKSGKGELFEWDMHTFQRIRQYKGHRTIINSIVICNTNSSATTFRAAVRVGGATLTNAAYVAFEIPIAGNATIHPCVI